MIYATTVREALMHMANLALARLKEGASAGELDAGAIERRDGSLAYSFNARFDGYSAIIMLDCVTAEEYEALMEAYVENVDTLVPYVIEREQAKARLDTWKAQYAVRKAKIFSAAREDAWALATEQLKGSYYGTFKRERDALCEKILQQKLADHPDYMADEDHPGWQKLMTEVIEADRLAHPGMHTPEVAGDIRKYAEITKQKLAAEGIEHVG